MFVKYAVSIVIITWINEGSCRDEERILKACFWPNEMYEPCFAGCAEVTCDNPRSHLRPCYPYCEPGCVCEEPYVRDDRTHQCVLPHDCSPTQMGIPVVNKRFDKPPSSTKHASRLPPHHHHQKRDENPAEYPEVEPEPHQQQLAATAPNFKMDDFKRPSEVSRMGNYFNIVIAPPPIKSLQPRKMINNGFGPSMKRLS